MRAIVNPAAGRGRAGARWPALRRALGSRLAGEAAFTTAPGEVSGLAREALRSGCERLLVVGGDGTFSEAINGFFGTDGQPVNPEAVLVPVTCGTGGDFCRTAGTPILKARGTAALARHLVRSEDVQAIDVGRVIYTRGDGGRQGRYFLNVASLGMGAAVDRRVRQSPLPAWLGGRATFFVAIAQVMLHYRNAPVMLEVDGRPVGKVRVRSVAVANGRFFGSGLEVAPQARLDDGHLDVVVLGDFSASAFVRHIGKLYAGTHLALEKVHLFRGRSISASSPKEVDLDIDGEPIGRLPATFEVVPRALRILR